MRTTFIETLVECAREDPSIWLLCGDLGYSVLEKFATAYPERYVNVGVAEQNMASMAGGLAMTGKIVLTYSIGNFGTLRCYEQIRNDICYHDANVKVIAVGGGLAYAGQGYTHHAVEELAALRALPNMTVIAPADPAETRAAVKWMLKHPHPVYLRLGKAGEPVLHKNPPRFEPGKMIPMREGKDALLISTGGMLETALKVADALAAKGKNASVASSPFVKPFDSAFVRDHAANVKLIATIEEHAPYGGLADAAAAAMADMDGARARLLPFNVPELLLKGIAGEHAELRARAGLSAEDITQRVLDNLSSIPSPLMGEG